MDNYGQDYFISQEGYASIDFTLLDRPSSTVASAPESTAALLPDLHVGDSSFSSFDFLDGPGVDAFGGVLREAEEAHSRDQGGYRSELHKYKKDQRSLHQNSVTLHRGDGDPESELPSSDFHMPFEVQKPMDFFSQGHTKDSAHGEQQAQSPGNDATDGSQDYFEHGQISQQGSAGGGGSGGWYPSWSANSNQGDQTQHFFQTPYNNEAADERRMLPVKGGTTQIATQLGYHSVASPQVPSSDPTPKAMHAFLPTAKQSDTRQAANMALGLPSSQLNPSSSSVIKSLPRSQPFDYEGLMNGASVGQFRQNSAAAVEASPARRQHTTEANLGGQDAMRSQVPSQSFKFGGQNLSSLASGVEVSPLKVGDYDFLGGQQFLHKGQTQGEIGQQLAVDDMQGWHQQSLLSQSSQQQPSYQHPYQDIARQELSRHQQQQVEQQQSQHSRQQQLQQFLATSSQNPNLGNQLSAFLSESSLQDIPRVVPSERQNPHMAVENPRSLLQQTNYQAMNNVTNLNWSANEPSAMQGLAHDYLMGADQNFNWQALALKASQQLDPSLYGSVSVNRRDTTGQNTNPYPGMQGGLQEYFGGSGKLTSAATQVGKPVPRSAGAGSSVFGSEYQSDVYDTGNLQTSTHSSKHQALGKMPFWQNPYPQAVEQSRTGVNLNQTNLPPRSPQLQRSWSGHASQQDSLPSGMLSAEALKQDMIATGIQQSGHQAASQSGNPRQARSQTVEPSQLMQQHGSQGASSSQFLNALGVKQQSGWNRHGLQQSVSQTGVPAESAQNLEGIQKSNWSGLNIQQTSSESQTLSNMKQQNIWSGHSPQQSRPAASSLHLFTDLDGRRSSVQGGHEIQQGSTQPAGTQQTTKFDVNQQSHGIQSASVQVSDAPNSMAEMDARHQSGWRDHLLLQGTAQGGSSLQGYSDLDKTSSWRNIWQNPPTAGGSSQMIELDSRHQTTGWGNSMQQSNSQAAESQVASINSREQSGWSGHDIQQGSPQTNQLLSSLDGQHQTSHLSHSVDGRFHSGLSGHMLHDEPARTKSSADVDGRLKGSSSPYNLQSQISMAETDARHKAAQMGYRLQSQAGTAEVEARINGGQKMYNLQSQVAIETDVRQKNAFSLPSQVGAAENDVRLLGGQNSYNLQNQVSAAENEARHKAGHNAYNLQTQIGSSEADIRQKSSQSAYNLQAPETDTRLKSGQSAYNLQTQAAPEPDGRNNIGANPYSLRSQVGTTELDLRHHKGSQSFYNLQTGSAEAEGRLKGNQSPYNIQSQGIATETDARHVGNQSTYNLQAQGTAAEADARQKGSQSAYNLQAQIGSFSQPSDIDGRQSRVQRSHNPQVTSQTNNAMYMFRTSSKSQNTSSSLQEVNPNAWTPSGSNAENWHKSTLETSGQQTLQHVGLAHVDAVDTRQPSGSQQGSPHNESHFQPASNSRPSSRLGRAGLNPQDSTMPGVMGTGSNASAASHWQTHGSAFGSSGASVSEHVPSWSRGQVRNETETLNLRADVSSGTPIEARPSWSRGQMLLGRKEAEPLNLGVDNSAGGTEAFPAWSRGQLMSTRKDDMNVDGETASGTSEIHPTWSRGQSISVRKDVEQLNLGGESENSANENMPSWSRGQSADSRKDKASEQLNLGQDTSSVGNEAATTWARGQLPSGLQELDQLKLGAESNASNIDSVLSWSRGQNFTARKESEQISRGEEPKTNTGSRKDLLTIRHEVDKRSQEEMSFLDAAAGRDKASLPSPAPSPDRNMFPVKQKSLAKVSPLSRSTLELLSKPEEPDESTSFNDDDQEDEEMEHEDSGGANASNISLAHLRRNQASGPLSPQGFGLRLAPPSHLTQNSQTGGLSRASGSPFNQGLDATRSVPPSSKEHQQISGTGVTDQSQSHRVSTNMADALVVTGQTEAALPIQQLPTLGSASNSGSALESSYYRNKDQQSADAGDLSSDLFEGNTSQPSASGGTSVKPVPGQSFLGATRAGETRQSSASIAPNSSQAVDPSSRQVSEDPYALGGSFSSTPSNAQSHFTSGTPQKTQQFSSNPPGGQITPQTSSFPTVLSSFKDSFAGQVRQALGGQQKTGVEKGSAERVMGGVFEARRSQAAGKLLNGMESSQWQLDAAQMSSSMKAEVFKRLAAAQAQAQAQAQNKANQSPIVQMNANQSGQGTATASVSGQAIPGHLVAGGQTNTAQTFPQGSTPGEGGILGQVYPGQAQGHGHAVAGKGSAGGQALAQGLSLSGHMGASEQTQPGPKHVQNFGATVHINNTGQIHPYSKSPGLGSSSLQVISGPSPASVQPTLANKQNVSQQRHEFPSSAGTGSESEQGIQQELSERGFQSQQPSGVPTAPSPLFKSQQVARMMQNNSLQSSFGQLTSRKDTSTRTQAPQEELPTPAEGRNTSAISGDMTGIKDGSVLNTSEKDKSVVAEDANGSSSVEAQHTRSNLEQYRARHDNQGSLQPGSRQDNHHDVAQQVSRAENQGGLHPQALRQDGKNSAQQHGVRNDSQDSLHQRGVSLALLHVQQHAARQDNQVSAQQQLGPRQDTHGTKVQQWQSQQSIEPSPLTDYQFQRLLESQPSIIAALGQYKSDPRMYQLAVAQLRAHFGQQHMARQLAQYQQQGRNELGIASTVGKPSSDTSASAQAAQLQAVQMQAVQAAQLQAVQAAQLHAHAAQVQAAQASQVHAVQAAQGSQVAPVPQAAQSGQLVQGAQAAQVVQATQAAIINKNASTAARLQLLSQLAQRGHSTNGLSQWYSGMAERPGSAAALYASRVGDGKGLVSAAGGATAGVAYERSGLDQPGVNRYYQNASLTPPPAKKRKKEYPPLIPWREAVSQAGGYVSTTSGAELEWAAASNRIPDKDPYEEVVDLSDTRSVVLTRAKRRLRFTTHLMQQIIPPVSSIHMASKSVEDRVGATYTLAKLSLAEACRIASIARRIKEVAAARDAEESRIQKERELALKEQERTGENHLGVSLPLNLADRFKLRMKHLEGDLQRLESSPSVMELVKEMHEIDRLGLVNRLAVHQTSLYSLSDSPNSRGVPQKYVTTVQMPSKLPEGLMCISL